MFNSQQKKAFTLIELLVVIAIIGILSAVALATFGATREQAKYAQLQNVAAANLNKFLGDCYNDPDITLLCGSEYYSFDNATNRMLLVFKVIPDVDMDSVPTNQLRIFGTVGAGNSEELRTRGSGGSTYMNYQDPGFQLHVQRSLFEAGIEYEVAFDIEQIEPTNFRTRVYVDGDLHFEDFRAGVLDGHSSGGTLQVGSWNGNQFFPGDVYLTGMYWD